MTIYSASKIGLTFVLFSAFIITGFGQVDVARRTTAITYPLDEQVIVQFRGTTRFPRMKGEARVKRTSRNGTEIDLSVSKMPRPFELGRGYATYVLWAISPDGQVDNLGEIKRRGFFEFDSKISVTTKLQTFALIITAEPHFLVKSPSQEIMLENLTPYAASGRKIETMPSIQYFGNSSDYFRDSRTPEIAEIDYSKTPSTILQAKQAIALAKYAGAGRDASDNLTEAESLLANAEAAWKAGRDEQQVDITARRAVSTAVKAESTAYVRKQAREKRSEQARNDADLQKAEDRYAQAQAEIEDLKSQLNGETRAKDLAQRDVANFSSQYRDVKAENDKLREEVGRLRLENENAKKKIASYEQEKKDAQTQADHDAKLKALQENEGGLISALKKFGTVTKTDSGIVLTLAESYWSAIRASTFAPAAGVKLVSLGEVLASNPDYKVQIESHTDDQGTPSDLETLTNDRSRAIAERLSQLGVAGDRLEFRGMGASTPVAPNTTRANRAKNRRVQLTLVPTVS